MKKILALALCLVMAMSLFAACGKKDEPTVTPEPTPAPTPAPAPAPTEGGVKTEAMAYFANFPDDKNVIAAKDLLPKIDAQDEMFILDIRSAEDYAKGHIKGASNIPFAKIGDNLDYIPNDKPVMVYCYTGQTASQATAVLNVAGKFAKNVQSGFNNGISKVEGYDKYVDTVEVPLTDMSYTTDADAATAAKKYFADMAAEAGGKFASFNVKPETVKELVDAESDDYVILSVRRAEDFEKGHIKGAVNIPYGKGMEAQFEAVLPQGKKVIVYCYSGQTSSQTVGILRLLGYEAFSMSGGMGNADAKTGWLGAGYEVVAN